MGAGALLLEQNEEWLVSRRYRSDDQDLHHVGGLDQFGGPLHGTSSFDSELASDDIVRSRPPTSTEAASLRPCPARFTQPDSSCQP